MRTTSLLKTLRKRKQGFSVPLREWFKHGLSEMVGDYLEYGQGRWAGEMFSRQKVAAVLRDHRRGVADHSRKIWLLLMFAAWHETYQASSLTSATTPAEYSLV